MCKSELVCSVLSGSLNLEGDGVKDWLSERGLGRSFSPFISPLFSFAHPHFFFPTSSSILFISFPSSLFSPFGE